MTGIILRIRKYIDEHHDDQAADDCEHLITAPHINEAHIVENHRDISEQFKHIDRPAALVDAEGTVQFKCADQRQSERDEIEHPSSGIDSHQRDQNQNHTADQSCEKRICRLSCQILNDKHHKYPDKAENIKHLYFLPAVLTLRFRIYGPARYTFRSPQSDPSYENQAMPHR